MIEIIKQGSKPTQAGPADYFTGAVEINAPFSASAPARVGGATVTFSAGARTAWHTHPLGQTLIVTAGQGWVQEWGQEAQSIGCGDVVWIRPDVKHWHGATADSSMTHIAIAEALEGKAVDWLEHVTEAQYQRKADNKSS